MWSPPMALTPEEHKIAVLSQITENRKVEARKSLI
jgi:hypothetical protein